MLNETVYEMNSQHDDVKDDDDAIYMTDMPVVGSIIFMGEMKPFRIVHLQRIACGDTCERGVMCPGCYNVTVIPTQWAYC
jgi:hypothetical protein